MAPRPLAGLLEAQIWMRLLLASPVSLAQPCRLALYSSLAIAEKNMLAGDVDTAVLTPMRVHIWATDSTIWPSLT